MQDTLNVVFNTGLMGPAYWHQFGRVGLAEPRHTTVQDHDRHWCTSHRGTGGSAPPAVLGCPLYWIAPRLCITLCWTRWANGGACPVYGKLGLRERVWRRGTSLAARTDRVPARTFAGVGNVSLWRACDTGVTCRCDTVGADGDGNACIQSTDVTATRTHRSVSFM